ncbi:choline BCCT transporter BetT [Halomonas organivorans]|uniref:Choline/glycine/proline betaine transport protein n=1 Tax=Halomonas organivorans TaxID=257772 RepID=A0A7W5BXQ1_9GAMM|nr:choline BCCT transporter BetT [Halomonas organivorans]MBB3141044.1 choline/glycine/proline betaine transport protein [Halomonas organivorans]
MANLPDPASEPRRDRINPVVFYGSAIGIVAFALWTMFFTQAAGNVINTVLAWISDSFGWFYFLAVVAYLVFVVCIGLSRYGKLRLGPAHSTPDFNIITWAAMLFSAGIGIDLLFFCIAEPVTQFLAPPVGEGGTPAAARHAMELTFLHWGLSGWGIYTLVGMSLAFFSYRHGLPLTIRSALYPLFGRRIHGPIGHSVDIAAVLGTVFGIATSLGIGIIQLNFGLHYMFGLPENTVTQAALAILIVVFSAISAVTGVDKGIRRLSEFNMLLAVLLMLFVLLSGKTLFLLNALVMNVGDYLAHFARLSFDTYAFNPPSDWLNAWTVFFWAWWIAWGPFVGLFLARISRGRTIRQFVAGTLILPLTFMMAWMSIMGNSAIDLVMSGTASVADFGEQAMNNPGSSIYLFLQSYPWVWITTVVTTILAIVFFVTSGDSGSLVLSNLTSVLTDPNHDAPSWMRILWAAIIGILTLALLMAGGLGALQSAVVIMGLPFAFVLFLMIFGLFKALKVEGLKEDSLRGSMAGHLSGRLPGEGAGHPWRQRLSRAMHFPSRGQARRFLGDTVRPAMEEIREVLGEQGITAALVESNDKEGHLELNVDLGGEPNFTYQVWPHRCAMPAFSIRATHAGTHYYRLQVHIGEGGQGYDIYGYTKEQVIADILDQYERHLFFLHTQRELPGGEAIMPDTPAARGE